MVTNTGQVTNSSASNKNDGVLLQVVADTGNVGSRLHTVGKSYSCDLTKCGVRLLRAGGGNLSTNTALLRSGLVGRLILQGIEAVLKNGGLGLVLRLLSSLSDKLVKRRHTDPPFCNHANGLFTALHPSDSGK